jgi:hypothetical protein
MFPVTGCSELQVYFELTLHGSLGRKAYGMRVVRDQLSLRGRNNRFGHEVNTEDPLSKIIMITKETNKNVFTAKLRSPKQR